MVGGSDERHASGILQSGQVEVRDGRRTGQLERLCVVIRDQLRPIPAPVADGLCLFSQAEVEEWLGGPVTVFGSPGACLWSATEPGRSLVSLTLLLDPAPLDAMLRTFPDAEELTIGELPALRATMPAGDSVQVFVTVDLGGQRFSVALGHDDPAVDAAALATDIVELALGRGVPGGPAPIAQPGG